MASQQGPARPFFRFASMVRPAPPAPTPEPPAQPQPQAQPQRPPVIRPTFTFRPTTAQPPPLRPPPVAAAPTPPQPSPTRVAPQPPATTISSVPTSPVTRASAPSSSLPTSPAALRTPPPPSPAPADTVTTAARTATPKSSPKIVNQLEKTPIQSPKTKPISHHPSPLILPPAQMKSENPEPEIRIPAETEKKTVLVQEKIEKHNVISKRESKIAQNGKPEAKKSSSSNSDEFGMSVITIAGENRGAVMEMSPSRKLQKFWGNPHTLQEKVNSESDDEKSKTKMKPHLTKYMNSNVQGVNNSIFFNSSSTHHDPGVHFSLSRKTNGHGGGSHFSSH